MGAPTEGLVPPGEGPGGDWGERPSHLGGPQPPSADPSPIALLNNVIASTVDTETGEFYFILNVYCVSQNYEMHHEIHPEFSV